MYSNKQQKKKGKGRQPARSKDAYAKTYGTPTRDMGSRLLGGGGRGTGAHESQLAKQVCSILDPFCAAAKGSKLPDETSTPTVAWSARHQFQLTTLANGTAAVEIRPNLLSLVRTASAIDVVTGDVTTYNAAGAHPDAATMTPAFTSKRIVSWGVRVFSSCNLTESKGVVSIISNTVTDPSTNVNIYSYSYSEAKAFPLYGLDATWVAKSHGPESRNFSAFGSTDEHSHVVIAVYGATPAISVLMVEVYFNLELLPIPFSVFAQLSTPAAAHNTTAMALIADTAANTSYASAENPKERHRSFVDNVESAIKKIERGVKVGTQIYQAGSRIASLLA